MNGVIRRRRGESLQRAMCDVGSRCTRRFTVCGTRHAPPGCRLACFAWEHAPLPSRHFAGSLRKITFFDFSRSPVRRSSLPLRHSFLPVHITTSCSLMNPRVSSGFLGHIAPPEPCASQMDFRETKSAVRYLAPTDRAKSVGWTCLRVHLVISARLCAPGTLLPRLAGRETRRRDPVTWLPCK